MPRVVMCVHTWNAVLHFYYTNWLLAVIYSFPEFCILKCMCLLESLILIYAPCPKKSMGLATPLLWISGYASVLNSHFLLPDHMPTLSALGIPLIGTIFGQRTVCLGWNRDVCTEQKTHT